MNRENFDDIIKKYTEALEIMGQTYGGEAESVAETPPKTENERLSQNEASYPPEKENPVQGAETEETAAENEVTPTENEEPPTENGESPTENADVNTDPAVGPPSMNFPEGEATSFAPFSAAVFSGEEAYPIAGARVVIYRGDSIYAFLTTDENGRTNAARLPAFEESNSLEADNPQQSIDYSADVFAEGFITQKGLLVSAVGGSDILLKVIMIPQEERIS